MSSGVWSCHMNTLLKVNNSACTKSLHTARSKQRKAQGHDNDSETVDNAVTYDNTQSKRGHTAKFAFDFAILVDAGKLLDFAFKSKVCPPHYKQKWAKKVKILKNGIRATKTNEKL